MKTLRARELFNSTEFKVIVVESVELQNNKSQITWQIYGKLASVAVIVCGRDGVYAINMEAKPVVLEELKRRLPELGSMITA